MPIIIGIGGCSRSGKSSLARQIRDYSVDKRVLILDMDDFVFPESKIPKIKGRTDWERPESVDFKSLGRTIESEIDNHDVIIVEGILVFANLKLLELYDTKVWIQISKETFLNRRKMETRWGDEPDWFLEHVWESHQRYGQFPKADFVLSGEEEIANSVIHTILQ